MQRFFLETLRNTQSDKFAVAVSRHNIAGEVVEEPASAMEVRLTLTPEMQYLAIER